MHRSRRRRSCKGRGHWLKRPLLAFGPAVLCLSCSGAAQDSAAIEATSEAVSIPITFGVGSSSDFEGGWRDSIDYAWNDTWGFWNRGNKQWNGRWAYNLQNAKWWWESELGSYSGYDTINGVVFFFSSTHGGNWLPDPDNGIPAQGAYAMWDTWSHAYTNDMKLSYTRGFFTKACDTHADDGYMMERWMPVFAYQGSLTVATGATGVVYDDTWFTSDTGDSFAVYIQGGNTFAESWPEAIHSVYATQYPSVMVSGSSAYASPNPLNCGYRLYHMNQWNMMSDAYYLPPWLVDTLCAYQVVN